jgi:hypothetical protein
MSCMFWSFVDAIDAHDGAVTAIATAFIAAFTVAMVCVSRRQSGILEIQAKLMQAQFDQWIELINWRCVGKPQNKKLRIMVDLINPTKFPITLTGNLTVGGEEWLADNEFLPPETPRPIEFKIPIGDDQWDVHPPVIAHFIYPDRITKTPIRWDLAGTLDCVTWRSDRQWPTFTRLTTAHTENQSDQSGD